MGPLPVLSYYLFFLHCVHHLKVSPFFLFYFWLCWVGLCCCTWTSCSERSCSLVVECRLLSVLASLGCRTGPRVQGPQQLQPVGSAVVAHGLSCSEACGIFPDQGLNTCPHTGRQIPKHWTTREVLFLFLIFVFISCVAYLEN